MEIRALLLDVNGTLIDIETDEHMEEAYRAIAHFLTYLGIALHRPPDSRAEIDNALAVDPFTRTAEPQLDRPQWHAARGCNMPAVRSLPATTLPPPASPDRPRRRQIAKPP
jgi:hypothetical protein